ncbi:MAG TPA: acylphosphatase [Geobacterales bacterium]|nr:acylphosphatase [Geobacterales bacterium]
MPRLVRAHLFIEGLVQGVFFRAYTKEVARENNVNGFVRNLPDGRVEAVLEGEEENVAKVIEFCKKGPPGAIVTNLEIIWEEYKGEFNNFKILY